MATQVDERVVSMQFNNSQFEQSASTTLNTLDQLKEALNFTGVDRGFNNITTAANGVNLSGLGAAVDSIQMKFSALEVMALSVMANLVNQAAAAGASMIRSLTISPIMQGFNEYELKMNSIQTIMSNVNATTESSVKKASTGIAKTAGGAAKAASGANKSAQKDLQKAQKAETKAFQKQAEAELKAFNDAAEQEIETTQEAQQEQLEAIADAHEEELEELRKTQKQELKELKQGYADQLEALNEQQSSEMDTILKNHNQKLELYQEEYMAKIKAIDEERYNELQAIQDQIDALNDLTEAENKARKEAQQQDKLQSLQEAADKARSAGRRQATEKALADYKAELAEEQAQEERKTEIEMLKEQMSNVKEVYDEKIDAAKEEYAERKELEDTSYTDQIAAVKEYYAQLKEAEAESYETRLEALQEQQEARQKEIQEEYETERKNLQKQLSDQLDAIRERQDSEREAIQDRQEEERDALNERQQAEMSAISSAGGAAGGAVGGVTAAALDGVDKVDKALKKVTLEDVTAALDELNEYADKTIYNFADMTSNIGKFVSAGVGLDDSVASIKGFSNVAALSGATATETSRAMYQLSQGISSGTIRLQDWNSLVQANTAGKVFQQSLIETARIHGVAIDEMMEKQGTLRETLQYGWLSSDIMVETLKKFTGDLSDEELKAMGYTDEQIKKIQEQAQNAVDAATKVRTWTQLISTMRESVGSGWAKTFELIFGNFDEATQLWTGLNDVFGELINKQADERNKLLEDWKNWGGRDMLLMGFSKMWTNLQPVIKAVQEGFREIFPKTTVMQLTDLSAKFLSFATHLKASDTLIANIKKTISGFSSVAKLAIDIVKAFINALIPGKATISGLIEGFFAITGGIGDFVTELVHSIENLNVIDTVFGAFGQVVEGAVKLFTGLIDTIVGFGKTLFKAPDTTFVTGFTKNVQTGLSPIGEIFRGVINIIEAFRDSFAIVFGAIGEIASNAVKIISSGVKGVGNALAQLPGFISGIANGVSEAVSKLFGGAAEKASQTSSKLSDILGKAWDTIKALFDDLKGLPAYIAEVGKSLGEALGGFFGGLMDSISFTDIFKGVTIANSAVGTSIGMGVSKIVHGLGDTMKSGKGIFEAIQSSIRNISSAISDLIKSFEKSNAADIISEVGKALAILAAALFVLSKVDTKTLGITTGVVGLAMGELATIVGILNGKSSSQLTINKDGIVSQTNDLGKQFVKLGESLLLVSIGMKIISTIDPERMEQTMEAVALFAIAGVGTVTALTLLSNKCNGLADMKPIIKFSESLILVGIAMRILGSQDPAQWNQAMQSIYDFAGIALATVGALTMVEALCKGPEAELNGFVKFAEALVIVGIAMRILGGQKPEEWRQAMLSVAGFGAIATSAVAAVTAIEGLLQGPEAQLKGFIKFAESLIILGAAMHIIGSLEPDAWFRAMVSVAGFAAIAIIAVGSLSILQYACGEVNMAALIVFATALFEMGLEMKLLADLDWSQIGSSLAAMAGSAAIMVVVAGVLGGLSASGHLDPDAIGKISTAMIKLSAAFLVLAPALKLMSTMSLSELGIALGALAGGFTVLGVAGAVIAALNLGPVITSLATAVAILGVGIAGVGAGLALFAAGLLALSGVGVAVVGNFIVTLGGIVGGFLEIIQESIPQIAAIAVLFVTEFCNALLANSKTIVDTFIQLTLVQPIQSALQSLDVIVNGLCDLIVKLFDLLTERVPELVHSIMGFVVTLINAVMEEVKNIDMEPFIKSLEGMGIISALIVIIAGVGQLAGPAATGLVKVGAVVLELIALLTLLGGIQQIPGVAWLMQEGSTMLYNIGNAIGKFVGGIIGGFGEGITASLPTIGQNLADFIDNAKPFFDGIKDFKSETAKAVGYLAEAILVLTAGNVIDAITKFMTGGESSLAAFGKELADFGPDFATFASSVENINAAKTQAAANAAKMLAEMAAAIPNEGGWVAKITGDNSLSKFAEELMLFGPSLMAFSLSVENLKADAVEKGVNSAQLVADFAKTIPNEGGLVSKVTGDNSLSGFATELMLFGPSIMSFALSVSNLKEEDVQKGVNAAQLVADFAKTIPATGGLVALVTGDNSISGFAKELETFGPSIMNFSKSVEGIDISGVEAATTAGKMLAGVAEALPETGGISRVWDGSKNLENFAAGIENLGEPIKKFADDVQGIQPEAALAATTVGTVLANLNDTLPETGGLKGFIFGDKDLGDFGENLKSLGESVASFCTSVAEIDMGIFGEVISQLFRLALLATNIEEIDTSQMTTFGYDLQTMASLGIDALIEVFDGCADRVTTAVEKVITYMNNAAEENVEGLQAAGESMGLTIINGVEGGIDNNLNLAVAAMVNLATTMKTTLTGNVLMADYVGVGLNIDTWTSNSITGNAGLVVTAITNLATVSIIGTLTTQLPMVTFSNIAKNQIIQGIVNGINNNVGLIKTALETAGSKAETWSKQSFNTERFNEAGKNVDQGVADGISDNTNIATSAAETLADTIKTKLGNVMEEDDFKYLGKNVVSGIEAGIDENAKYARQKAQELAEEIASTIESALEIESPSKRTKWDGQMVVEGMILGMEYMMGAARSTADTLANTAADPIEEAIQIINDSIEASDSEFQPTITPVVDLSNVMDAAGRVGGLFNALPINTSSALAQSNAVGFNSVFRSRNTTPEDAIAALNTKIDTLAKQKSNEGTTTTNYNTFNIRSTDPKAAADEINYIMQHKIERRRAAWAR